MIDVLGNLASLYEETNQVDEARSMAESVLSEDAKHPHANLVMAKCERRSEQFDSAVSRLEKLDAKAMPAPLYRDVAFELSRLYDRQENAAEAFAAMATGNSQALIAEGVDESLGDQFLDTVERIKSWLAPETGKALNSISSVGDGYPDPVFLVGFPRSGTTLLGQILDSHSSLVMVEERPMLDRLVSQVRSKPGGYPDALLSLDKKDLSALRKQYFESADRECDRKPGQRIVDKFPLHLVHAGLVRAVFPNARFILALRHPCDVVLSCFMQNFRPNPAMANFFSIERGARTYDTVMDLWRSYTSYLNPPSHPIRYENVVTDFNSEISELLAFLGLDWESGVLDYAENARARGKIDTPSYAQVTENLYTRARYRWLRYEDQMKPVMADLEPWIQFFGYDKD